MKNNHGQSLVLFIIFIPVLLMLFMIAIEKGNMLYNKKKIMSVTKNAIKNCLDSCQKNDIIDLYNKNDIYIEDIDIIMENSVEIKVSAKYQSLLNNIIDVKNNIIKIDLIGTKDFDKIRYEKG